MKDYNKVEFDVYNSDLLNLKQICKIITTETEKEKIEEFVEGLEIKSYDYVDPCCLDYFYSFCYVGRFGEDDNDEIVVVEYSQLMLLQFNDIDDNIFDEVKQKSKECKHSAMVFNTIFGNGIYILVPVNTEVEYHDTAYEQVKDHYENLLGIESDNRTKDVLYACLIGYDSDCFYNRYATRFKVNLDNLIEPESEDFETDFVNKIESSIVFTEKREKLIVGNENDFFKLFAVNCNNMGYDVGEVIRFSRKRFDLKNYSVGEMEKTIRFVYSTRKHEFGSKQKRGGNSKYFKESSTTSTLLGLDEKLEKFGRFLKPYIIDEDDREIVTTFLKGLLIGG